MLDENNVVIKYLKKLKYEPDTSYYPYIALWKEWYENYVPEFHKYYDQYGEKREIYKLGMAKRVCEDWSSILYSERDSIVCENENNSRYLEEELNKLKFNDVIPQNIETAFWSGTVGTILRVKNASIESVGGKSQLTANEKTKYSLVSVNASQIVPLRVEDGKIIDVAFVSSTKIEDKIAYYIEIHELKENGYVIKNKYIDEDGNEKSNEKVLSEFYTYSNIPLFSILSPRVVSNIEDNNGLGLSIYANAIDQLKGCDIAYNNFVQDYYLGGKKIFYNKKLVRYEMKTYKNKKGEAVTVEIPIFPDDLMKQQWQVVGDPDENPSADSLITEYNPELREQENENGNNFALGLLAFKCGLGKSYYKFQSDGSIVTATQAILDNQDLVGNAKKHRSAVNDYTIGIVRAILLLGRILFKVNGLDENDEINLVDKDGFMVSEEDLKEQYMQEIAAGLRSKVSYLVKFNGMTEEQALKELQYIRTEDTNAPNIEDEEDDTEVDM